MKKNWILMLLFALAAVLIAPAQAGMENIRCFKFKIDTPANEPVEGQDTVIGCYARVEKGQQMAFVQEEDGANLLTTALTFKKGNQITLKHFSMSAGKINMIEQEDYVVNPLPIPPLLEEALESDANLGEVAQNAKRRSDTKEQIKSLHQIYMQPGHQTIKVPKAGDKQSNKRIYEVEEAYLPSEKLPTDGYWWPHIGAPLYKDEWAPLPKYDAYVKSVSGYNPNTVGWERVYHASNTEWAGHCNGWVSATILHGYDDMDLKDDANNVVISRSDLQGLRSVQYYCTRNAFYGKRNRGNGDINDIYPDQFHRLLNYYIKHLQKAVSYDFRNDAAVDNHIISGYRFEYQETDEPNKVLVKATLRSHGYSYNDYVHEKRVAPEYEREYWYYLWKNRYGRFYKGEWVNPQEHPDFMWVPLREGSCGRENPRLRGEWIEHMINNLEHI